MHPYRKLASILVGCALPMATVVNLSVTPSAGAVSLSNHKSGTVSGTVNCSGSQGSITFKPPLLGSGTAKPEKSVEVKISSLGTCTSGGSAVSIKKATAKVIVGSGSTDLCSNFANGASSDGLSMAISYKTKGVKATSIRFSPGSISEIVSPSLGFQATDGTATGSYSGTATFTVPLTTSSATEITNCIGGTGSVTSLQFSAGSATY